MRGPARELFVGVEQVFSVEILKEAVRDSHCERTFEFHHCDNEDLCLGRRCACLLFGDVDRADDSVSDELRQVELANAADGLGVFTSGWAFKNILPEVIASEHDTCCCHAFNDHALIYLLII
mgnify:CR=1 FL=1|jgi:hypothetical protein